MLNCEGLILIQKNYMPATVEIGMTKAFALQIGEIEVDADTQMARRVNSVEEISVKVYLQGRTTDVPTPYLSSLRSVVGS